jgi:hypothetical protein
MSCFRTKYGSKEYMLGGESILIFYLKFKEFIFAQLNRIIGKFGGKYMTDKDEIQMIADDKGRFEDYAVMIRKLVARKETEHGKMVGSVKMFQKAHRDKSRRWFFFIMTVVRKARAKKLLG